MNPYRTLILAGLLGLAACQPKDGLPGKSAGGSDGASGPVASVNGQPVRRDFFEAYVNVVAGRPAAELSQEQRDQLLDNLIRMRVIADQATRDGLDEEPETAALLELSRLQVLQQAMSERYLEDKKPTQEELRAEYDAQVAALPKQEYHARHILVATEAFAQKLVQRLEKGADFAELAARESMDEVSKRNGGDLGWFTPDRMVKPFSDAVVALKPGQFTRTPVQTQYGWHVIRLEATRDVTPPPYESVEQRLEQIVQAKKFKAYTDQLIQNAKVEKTL